MGSAACPASVRQEYGITVRTFPDPFPCRPPGSAARTPTSPPPSCGYGLDSRRVAAPRMSLRSALLAGETRVAARQASAARRGALRTPACTHPGQGILAPSRTRGSPYRVESAPTLHTPEARAKDHPPTPPTPAAAGLRRETRALPPTRVGSPRAPSPPHPPLLLAAPTVDVAQGELVAQLSQGVHALGGQLAALHRAGLAAAPGAQAEVAAATSERH